MLIFEYTFNAVISLGSHKMVTQISKSGYQTDERHLEITRSKFISYRKLGNAFRTIGLG